MCVTVIDIVTVFTCEKSMEKSLVLERFSVREVDREAECDANRNLKRSSVKRMHEIFTADD
jgi:hypothetical protein